VASPKKEKKKQEKDPTKPSFRITCKRNGDIHSFDSMSAGKRLVIIIGVVLCC
jgi:adenylyl- and sulfurtransferase ThiI